jgi:hypothetical protein
MSSNQLLVAGLLSALGLGGAGLGLINSEKSPPKTRSRQGRFVQTGGPNSMYPTNRADLAVRPPDYRNVPKFIPRNIQNKVVWDTVKVDGTITTSTSSIVETNFNFSLNGHPQASNWVALYDQFHIAQVTVTFRSLQSPGNTGAPSLLYTALDFDSAGTLGSVAAIEDFASCEVKTMSPGALISRSIKPCVKSMVAQTNGGSSYSDAVSRTWLDSQLLTTINHYGIRSILSASTNQYVIETTTTIWYAFRNSV